MNNKGMLLSYLAYYYISFLLYVFLLFLALPGEKRSHFFFRIALLPPVAFNGLAFLMLSSSAGHLPTHYLFERFIQLSFGLGLLLYILTYFEDTRKVVRYVVSMIVVLLAICLLFPMNPSPLAYRYSFWTARFFFQLETLGFIFLSFSSAYCLLYLMEKKQLTSAYSYLQKARRYLLLGFVFFLMSQFSGSIWSWYGWGDYFVWGKMTFLGIVMWLYIMFVIHSRYIKRYGEHFLAHSGTLLFVIIIMYRMAWQP